MSKSWKVWETDLEYGDLFYKRAIGELPEMESSKSVARYVAKLIKNGDTILDVGCGGGHYLVSLDKAVRVNFSYYGVDATEYYIKKAKEAFLNKKKRNPKRIKTDFRVGDIYKLAFKKNFADIVMCNNVLLHLLSAEQPLKELWRTTKRYLILRTLIGKCSFRIKQIYPPEKYTQNGEPVNFNYLNIYSENYIKKIIRKLDKVKKINLFNDNDFDPKNIGRENYRRKKKFFDLTKVFHGMQINNYIIYPWSIMIIEKSEN